MPHLQGLQAKLEKMGVLLLGFNPADDKEVALRFLQQAGVTFPTVLDAGPQARRGGHELYGARGVPAHYIICNGFVVDAWMGFDAEHARAWAAFERLGVAGSRP